MFKPAVTFAGRDRPCLVLGGAQLGMPYGVSNRAGIPSEDEAVALVQSAILAGVHCIDTARAYGESERRIGFALVNSHTTNVRLITKLDPLAAFTANSSRDIVVESAGASLEASRRALGRTHIDVLLLHRAQHRTEWNGVIWDLLRKERAESRIGRLGISVQSPAEARTALSDPDVQHIQLPFNLLDYRWRDHGIIDQLRARHDVTVHVRSALLQGLLVGQRDTRWPTISGVLPRDLLALLKIAANEFCRSDLVDLAIGYVRAQNWVDGIVIGVDTQEQLQANLALFQGPPLTERECVTLAERLPRMPEQLLDPARWSSG